MIITDNVMPRDFEQPASYQFITVLQKYLLNLALVCTLFVFWKDFNVYVGCAVVFPIILVSLIRTRPVYFIQNYKLSRNRTKQFVIDCAIALRNTLILLAGMWIVKSVFNIEFS